MSLNREDETRKALRKDVGGEYKLPPLDRFHVNHKPAQREPTAEEMWKAYMKALDELRKQTVGVMRP